jgi:spore germination cell wall hydrolase CwlJ-like protein
MLTKLKLALIAGLAVMFVVSVGRSMDVPAFRHLDLTALSRFDFSIFWLRRGEGEALRFTDKDRDLMIRTLYGEAVHEPRLGQMAVAWVIRNRYEDNPYGWNTISKVVTHCGFIKRDERRIKICQFEPWLTREKEIMALDADSHYYRHMASVVDDVLEGRTSDPTNGAWYFLNKKTVQKRRAKEGREMPKWAKKCTDIGRHSFCKPDEDRSAGVTRSLKIVWRYLKKLVSWDV